MGIVCRFRLVCLCRRDKGHLQGVVGCRLIQRVIEDFHERRAVQIGGENVALRDADVSYFDGTSDIVGKF